MLGLWLAAFGLCWQSSADLQRVRRDDVLSYLPRDAQSTQAYELTKAYGDSDIAPAVITYERTGGLTKADRVKIAQDAATWDAGSAAGSAISGGPAGGSPGGPPNPAARAAGTAAPGPEVSGGKNGGRNSHKKSGGKSGKVSSPGRPASPSASPSLPPAALAASALPPSAPSFSPVAFSDDGQAAQFAVPFDGNDPRLADHVKRLRSALRPLVPSEAGLTIHVGGPAGQSADSYGVFDTIDGPLLYLTLGVVMVLLLITYRSPVLWVVPLAAAFAGLSVAQEAAYLLAEHAGLTVNGLSQGIMLVLTIGAGVDYALLLISRYREELTRYRDKHDAMAVALRHAGPAIVASAGTVSVSLLCLLLSALNSDRGLGPVAAVGVLGAFASMVSLLPALLVALPRHMFWPQVPHYSAHPTPRQSVWGAIARAVAARPRVTWVAVTLVLLAMASGLLGLKSNGLSTADAFPTKPDSIRAQDTVDRHFPTDPGDLAIVIGNAQASSAIRKAVHSDPGIVPDSSPPRLSGTYTRFDVAVIGGPDSSTAQTTVRRLRTTLAAIPGADARVGGLAAINLDIVDASRFDRDAVIPAVLFVVLLVLIALLRSLVAPVLLMATVVLSFGAALGASWLVFRYCFGFTGTDVSYPLFSFVFLVALGIDYNIFLMTRIQEEARLHGTRQGTIRGVTVTGGVITSAGVVLAATFALLTTLPLVTLIEIGFTVAFGVLLDTLVVRSMLVPALAVDIGRRIWWPWGSELR